MRWPERTSLSPFARLPAIGRLGLFLGNRRSLIRQVPTTDDRPCGKVADRGDGHVGSGGRGPDCSWGSSSSNRTTWAASGSSRYKVGSTGETYPATDVRAWNSPGRASTRVILSPAAAGRQPRRTARFEVKSSCTFATIRSSRPSAPAQSDDHRHNSEAARVRPGAVVGAGGAVVVADQPTAWTTSKPKSWMNWGAMETVDGSRVEAQPSGRSEVQARSAPGWTRTSAPGSGGRPGSSTGSTGSATVPLSRDDCLPKQTGSRLCGPFDWQLIGNPGPGPVDAHAVHGPRPSATTNRHLGGSETARSGT